MPRIIDKAICLRETDWSESSQVVVLLTERFGKVRGLAKGSRRQSPSAIARFSGGINLLNLGQVVVTTKPATQLAAVTEWDLQRDHYHLRTNLSAQWSAMYAAELADAMLLEEDPHQAVFDALARFLEVSAEPKGVAIALLRYQWSVLCEAGYRPTLDRDVADGAALGPARAYSFDPRLGGLTARQGMGDERWRVRAETVDALRAIAGEKINANENALATKIDRNDNDFPLDEKTIDRANRLLCTYVRALIDKELPTMRTILKKV